MFEVFFTYPLDFLCQGAYFHRPILLFFQFSLFLKKNSEYLAKLHEVSLVP